MSDYPAGLIDGFTRGTHLLRAGLCDEAMVEFRAVYAEARHIPDEDLMAACLCEMGWCSYKLGQTEQALECAMGARGLRQRQGNTTELARAMAVEAIVFLDLGFSDEAFDLSAEAVDLAQAGSDPAILAFALNAKGLVLAVCRETELGMALIERAVALAAEQANIAAEAYYLLNLGFCHTKIAEEAETFGEPGRAIGEREAAIDLSERAIVRAESSGDHWTLRVALCNTAEMLGLQGRHDLALAYLERHSSLPGDPGPSLRIHYLYTLGDIALRSGDLAQASSILEQALALADSTQQLDHQVNSARKLAEVLEIIGDAAAALAIYKRFHALYVTQSGETARRRARIEAIRAETEQWRSRATTLADQALNDALTGIANRRSFDQILNRLAGTPIALAVLDLDHFKSVNDRFSHIVGDAVLQRVARAIVDQIGPHGHAARLGGEEFGLIFPDASEAIAAAFCEGVRIAISCTDWSDMAPGLEVTASIGLAAGDGTAPSGELMQLADNRLYIAKRNGRDRLVLADDATVDKQRWRA